MFLEFLHGSSTSPCFPVECMLSCDEYQADQGNLPHAHLMVSLDYNKMNDAMENKINELIRASVAEIVRTDEVEQCINEGVFSSWEDLQTLQHRAANTLKHRCNPRCMRRVGDGDGPENFVCRKLNNLLLSKDNTKHALHPLPLKLAKECVEMLIRIGLANPFEINEFGVSEDAKYHHSFFKPNRHIPPTNPNDYLSISPAEGRTFAMCKSMQNAQSLTNTNGLNKHVCKCIGKMDEANNAVF